MDKKCTAKTDCNGSRYYKAGYCRRHYENKRRKGDADALPYWQTLSLRDRFFKKGWEVMPSGCWHWKGTSMGGNNYGYLRDYNKNLSAHRVSVEIFFGVTLKPEDFVCHKCDNKICVNPDHLYVGNRVTNGKDRAERDPESWLRGDAHPRRKITAADARVIYELKFTKLTTTGIIGNNYGISRITVSAIWNKRLWRVETDKVDSKYGGVAALRSKRVC